MKFFIILNLIVVSILPLVGAWSAYQKDPELLQPTKEWGTAATVASLKARSSRRLSRQDSYGVTANRLHNFNTSD